MAPGRIGAEGPTSVRTVMAPGPASAEPAELVIAILNWNGYALTRACVRSLARLEGPGHTILIVDSGSKAPEAERLAAEFPGIVPLSLGRNVGVAGGYNASIRWARNHGARFVLLLNNDTLVQDPLLARRLVDACAEDVFAVGPLVRDGSGRVWSSGGTMDWQTYLTGHWQEAGIISRDSPYEVAWIDGSCMLVSVAAACDLGGFDETFFLYWEETDICFRARDHGLRCLVEPRTEIVHLVGQTARPSQVDRYMMRNSILFMRRHANLRQNVDFMLRLACWRAPIFAARRIKHRGGIRQTAGIVLGSFAWNILDAIRERGWRRRPGGSLVCEADSARPAEVAGDLTSPTRPLR